MTTDTNPEIAGSTGSNPGGFKPTYRRSHTTKKSVLFVDAFAGTSIQVGGLLVILAVFGIMIFLAQVVVPLFTGASLKGEISYKLPPVDRLLHINVDEYKTILVRISGSGRVETFHAATGKPLGSHDLGFQDRKVTATASTLNGENLALGFDDGFATFVRASLSTVVITEDNLPKGLTPLNDTDLTDGTAVFAKIVGGQYRKITPNLSMDEPSQITDDGSAIVALDTRISISAERPTKSLVSVDSRGVVRVSRTETQFNLFSGQSETAVSTSTLPPLPSGAAPFAVLMTAQGDQVYAFERKGTMYRFDLRDLEKPVLAETVALSGAEVQITAVRFLIGEDTLVIGFSDGAVGNYFRLRDAAADTKDGYRLVKARRLESQGAGIVDMNVSQRRKGLVTLDVNGGVWFRYATSEQTLLKLSTAAKVAGARVLLAPRSDGIFLVDKTGAASAWNVYAPHPETTVASIFGKVWYEGYSEPNYTWQSSSGTDTFEPKLSLVPLIFGTLKATLYSLLFALPVALSAAIYTSEFLHRRVRATVKPVMEMMESLPTVVLGFVAALILAPIVENWIAAVILAFFVLPLSFTGAAFAWQLIPLSTALRLEGVPKFIIMFGVVGAASYAAYAAGPSFEAAFFFGDLKAWANGDIGTGTPFMSLVLFPLAVVMVSMAVNNVAGENIRLLQRASSAQQAAVISALRWLAVVGAGMVLAFVAAVLLSMAGFDPRGGVVDTYVQRNALVVGFVMGFAVIPNIYTLAEDALNAVPSHLRAGALAAGATPWQTAVAIVLPTAMSGVFAAVMIGMGRAVGETMIVVMAAGNTPVLEWNIFNGLRTLSANIAVELPEAVVDGTLYRTLFMAALVLFIITFVINTFAEIIRQRFRRRAFQL